MSDVTESAAAVAFVGTYGPRRCGIASFTADLAHAVEGPDARMAPMILAVTDPAGQYQYPAEVRFEIRQNVKADYPRAAEFVNFSHVRLVSIQHEYGIFGGDDGGYILDFVQALRVPAVVTLHTVLKNPSANQLRIVQRLAAQCRQLIVMSQIAKDLLASSYGVTTKVRIIAHGIPVMERGADPASLKAKFGVSNRRLLLTFGLLSPNKGIETVIRALPEVVRTFPDLIYFVVGATHPVIVRREGEAYRTMLEREAEKLGVREHLVFRGQFVSSDELRQYLIATDIFVSPYLNEAQVTSGALSYAMGAGAAVVSTPYWHAQELLAHGRGCLFPFKDHVALSGILRSLLGSPEELRRVRDAAVKFAQSMVWPRIGDEYFELFSRILRDAPRVREVPTLPPERSPLVESALISASSLPDLRLDHLIRLTDDTGIIQHATYSVPSRRSGYCVDDNARALIVAVHVDHLQSSAETRALVTRYLGYLDGAQNPDGSFSNFMSYARVPDDLPPSDDCLGRALWALGVAVEHAQDAGCRSLARELFERSAPHMRELGPRGTAQAVLGLLSVLAVDPNAVELRGLFEASIAKLLQCYRDTSSGDWRWFEASLTYDNALLPLALFAGYSATGDRASLRDARESLEFLEEACFVGDRLELVGNRGWYVRGQPKASADEQPVDACALVMAFHCAYMVTKDRHYLSRMRQAFAWFLGANRLSLPLYDFATGGCCDGIGETRINQNQGAESTICFLLSLLKMHELAGEELKLGDTPALSDD